MIHLEPEDTKESLRKRVPIHYELAPILEEAMRTPFLASDKVFLVKDDQGIRTPGTDTAVNPWQGPANPWKRKSCSKAAGFLWSRGWESNPRPADYESAALASELPRPV
jgi:hypothetical protein